MVLWLLLTSHSSLLLQISLSVRPHGINQYSFLVYLLGLHSRVTVTFWTSLLLANLSAYYALVPSFCPSGYDFAIPSSRLHLTMQTLGVAIEFVGNYASVDFHRRALICPSYQKEPRRSPKLFFLRTEKSQGNTLKASTNIRWMRRNSDERAAASAGSWRCCRPGVPEGGETAASRSIEGGLPILLLQWSHMLRLTSEGRLRRSASSSVFLRGLPGVCPGVLFNPPDA